MVGFEEGTFNSNSENHERPSCFSQCPQGTKTKTTTLAKTRESPLNSAKPRRTETQLQARAHSQATHTTTTRARRSGRSGSHCQPHSSCACYLSNFMPLFELLLICVIFVVIFLSHFCMQEASNLHVKR